MSVPDQTPIVQYTANGNTVVFPYNFYVLRSEDLDVYVNGQLKTETTDYSVTGIGVAQGGNVTFVAAAKPPANAVVIVKRSTPVERVTNYAHLGDLQADTLNQDFDRLWLALQEQRATFGTSISRPAGGIGDWDAQDYKITRVKAGTATTDAVNYDQLFTVQGNANSAAQAAAQSAQSASQNAAATAGDRQQTGLDRTAASQSASSASADAGLARKWASEVPDTVVADGLFSARHYASKAATSEGTATAAAATSTAAAGTASSAASTATTQADRAKTEADKLGNMNDLAAAIQSVIGGNVTWKGTQSVLVEGGNDGDLVTVRQLRAATAGGSGSAALINGVMNNFIGAVEWANYTSRTTLPVGYLPADGQILNRADYPELWAAINAGIVKSITDTAWTGDALKRGAFSTGNGTTTFRLPDLNGAVTNSVKALFLRGDNGAAVGDVQQNAIGQHSHVIPARWVATGGNTDSSNVANASTAATGSANVNTSNTGGTETRPNAAVGIWLIRVNGSFTAANTNFSVLNGAASAPASGVTVDGGLLASKYQVAGADYATASLTARVTGGATPVRQAMIGIGDGTNTDYWTFRKNEMWGPDGAGVAVNGGALKIRNAARTDEINFSLSGANMLVNRGGTITGIDLNGTELRRPGNIYGQLQVVAAASYGTPSFTSAVGAAYNENGRTRNMFAKSFLTDNQYWTLDAFNTGSDIQARLIVTNGGNSMVYTFGAGGDIIRGDGKKVQWV